MGKFQFIDTCIPDLKLINPFVYEDNRGCLIKYFERQEFEKMGLPICDGETLEAITKKGVLKGMHFQYKNPQGKYVRVIRGEIYDVAIDLRINSQTFGKWQGFYLSSKNKKILYIPPGFAHGYLTLEEDTIMTYRCTDIYIPEYDSGIVWNDKDLKIDWPLEKVENLIISDKDKKLFTLEEYLRKCKSNLASL